MATPPKFCSRCGKRPPRPRRRSCEPCAEAARTYEREKRERIPAGKCTKCGKRRAKAGFKQCSVCRDKQAASMLAWRYKNLEHSKKYMREYVRSRRHLVLAHYGGECACCGESAFEFLALDHVNGDGDWHRRTVGGGAKMVEWIIKQGYPDTFRVLCHNCNQAIGYYGECPHQRK